VQDGILFCVKMSHKRIVEETMQPIIQEKVQGLLDVLKGQDIYIHLEMTSGAYAAHFDSTKHPSATFITNAVIRYTNGSIAGEGPYRVGLKTENGWVYSEGLTHWEETDKERLIMAGHDLQGKLVVALQLSRTPF
jgi:hypothetical protein